MFGRTGEVDELGITHFWRFVLEVWRREREEMGVKKKRLVQMGRESVGRMAIGREEDSVCLERRRETWRQVGIGGR